LALALAPALLPLAREIRRANAEHAAALRAFSEAHAGFCADLLELLRARFAAAAYHERCADVYMEDAAHKSICSLARHPPQWRRPQRWWRRCGRR
jgi:hypothetical protein